MKADGNELPSPRPVRTTVLPDGSAVGTEFTLLGLLFVTFVTLDFTPETAVDASK